MCYNFFVNSRKDQQMKKLMMAAIAVCAAMAQAVAERSEESFADLPEGYVRLEYIQGDGVAAYIQTDYTPTPKTDRIEMEFALTDLAGTQALLWSNLRGFGKRWDFLWFGGNNPKQFRFGYDSANTLFAASPAANERYTVAMTDNELAWSGGDGVTVGAASSYACSLPLAIFATPLESEVMNFSSMRMYSLVVARKGRQIQDYMQIHDYIPCLRISDFTFGLYDACENRFFGNSGTGLLDGGAGESDVFDVAPIPDQDCTGRKIRPAVEVKDVVTGRTLVRDADYAVYYYGNKDIGTRIELQVLTCPLRNKVVRDNEHTLGTQSDTLLFLGGGNHRKGFAGTDDMSQ